MFQLTAVEGIAEHPRLSPSHLQQSFAIIVVGISCLIRCLTIQSGQQFTGLTEEKPK
jgi:hypothetical protein